MTFVAVNPVISNPPAALKNVYESWRFRKSSAFSPSFPAASKVSMCADGSRGVGRAIFAVGAAAEDGDVIVCRFAKRKQGREHELLVAAALAGFLAKRHRRLAAAEDAHRR